MNISRRSFLKMAGLSTVAVAGAVALTSCATPVTPNLTIIYQEEKKDNAFAFTGSTSNLIDSTKNAIWKDGKKTVYSKEQFFVDMLKKVGELDKKEDVIKKITDELKKDYTMTGKTVSLVGDPKVDSNGTYYTITITFKVVAANSNN